LCITAKLAANDRCGFPLNFRSTSVSRPSATLRWTTEQVQDVTFLDLPTRLAKALLRLVRESELPDGGGKLTITQRELSQVIGRSRESTNKQLRIWAKQGWVRLQRGAVTVLQPEKLDEVAAEAAELDAS
jgi:CRP/FNR family cyclic AMP-dependent transcriptional regulator